MPRAILLAALALSVVAPPVLLAVAPAQAMEMFTNFDNGQNAAGFPPMMVPVAIYGPGGWNCGAMGCVAVPSALPAQWPTGCERRLRPTPRSKIQVNFAPPVAQLRRDSLRQSDSEFESDGPTLAEAQPSRAGPSPISPVSYDAKRSMPDVEEAAADAASGNSSQPPVSSRRSARQRAAAMRAAQTTR